MIIFLKKNKLLSLYSNNFIKKSTKVKRLSKFNLMFGCKKYIVFLKKKIKKLKPIKFKLKKIKKKFQIYSNSTAIQYSNIIIKNTINRVIKPSKYLNSILNFSLNFEFNYKKNLNDSKYLKNKNFLENYNYSVNNFQLFGKRGGIGDSSH